MKFNKNKIESDIQIHIFMCTNERTVKNKSCGKKGSLIMFKYLKQRMKTTSEMYSKKVKVNSSGCLSSCSNGPVVVCYPEGIWYNISSNKDVDMLINRFEKLWLDELKLNESAVV